MIIIICQKWKRNWKIDWNNYNLQGYKNRIWHWKKMCYADCEMWENGKKRKTKTLK